MAERCILNVLCLQCNKDFTSASLYQEHVNKHHNGCPSDLAINDFLPSESDSITEVSTSLITPTFTCGGCNMKFVTEDYLLTHLDFCQGTPTVDLAENLIQHQVQPKKPKKATEKRQTKANVKKQSKRVLNSKNRKSSRLKNQRQELGSHKNQRRVKSKESSVETEGVVLSQRSSNNKSGRTLRSSANVSYMDIDTDVDDRSEDDGNEEDEAYGNDCDDHDDNITWAESVRHPPDKSKAKVVKQRGKDVLREEKQRYPNIAESNFDEDALNDASNIGGEAAEEMVQETVLNEEPEIGKPLEMGDLKELYGSNQPGENDDVGDDDDDEGVNDEEFEQNKDFALEPQEAEKNRFKCDQCGDCFPTTEVLSKHTCIGSYQSIETGYQCKRCLKITKTLDGIKRHLQNHRNREMGKVFPCQICGKEYQSIDGRKKHMKVHTNQQPSVENKASESMGKRFSILQSQVDMVDTGYKCKHCSKIFGTRASILSHLPQHEGEGAVSFTCGICHRQQATRDGHMRHMKAHAGKEKETEKKQPVELDTDDYTLYINGVRAEDMVEVSSLRYVHRCEICEATFKSEKIFRLHVWKHNLTKTDGLFDCPLCEKKQKTDDGWRKHMTCHFLEEKNYLYQCNKCGHSTTTMENIKKHIKTHRAKVQGNLHECKICGCWLETLSGLRKHLQRHEELNSGKTYDCSICSKVFHSESGLRKHMKLHTEIERGVKHICHVCGLELQSFASLQRHERIHNGEVSGERYECSTCGKAFKIRGGLRKHERLHTEGNLLNKRLWWKHRFDDRKFQRENGRCKRRRCRVCGLHCKSFGLLLLHEQKRHEFEMYDCTQCEQRCYHKCVYDSHVRHHAGKKMFDCKQCSESCPDIILLRKHKKAHKRELYHSAKDLFNSLPQDENNKETMSNIKNMYGKKMLELVQRLQKGEELGDKHYVCSICGHTTGVHFDYMRHVESHTGTRPFKCPLCNRAFFTRSHLNEHISSHTGDRKPYSCTVCGKAFSTETGVRRHENLHTGMKLVWCTLCHKKLSSSNSLIKHRAKVHKGQNNTHQCSVCDKMFLTGCHLTSHVYVHLSNKLHTCLQCGKQYTSITSLTRHEKMHSKIKCHRCDCCEMSFYLPCELKRHKLRVHLGTNPYICDYPGCKSAFQFKCDLKLHNIGHYSTSKEPKLGHFPCSRCDMVFQSATERHKHRRKVHEKRRITEYQTCEYCGKKVQQMYMKVHVRKHTGETLECDLCGKKFYDERMLKNHLLVHNDMKPYSCDVCGKKTVTSTEMKLHKRGHTGEKPFKCKYCDKNFRDQTTRRIHEMRHRGEKPHQCPDCPMAYVTSSLLRQHLRKGHNEKPPKTKKRSRKSTPKKKIELEKEQDSESEVSDYVVYGDSEDEKAVKEEEQQENDDIDDSEWISRPHPSPVTNVESALDIPVITGKQPIKMCLSRVKTSGLNGAQVTKSQLAKQEDSPHSNTSLRVSLASENKPIGTAMIGPDSDEEPSSSASSSVAQDLARTSQSQSNISTSKSKTSALLLLNVMKGTSVNSNEYRAQVVRDGSAADSLFKGEKSEDENMESKKTKADVSELGQVKLLGSEVYQGGTPEERNQTVGKGFDKSESNKIKGNSAGDSSKNISNTLLMSQGVLQMSEYVNSHFGDLRAGYQVENIKHTLSPDRNLSSSGVHQSSDYKGVWHGPVKGNSGSAVLSGFPVTSQDYNKSSYLAAQHHSQANHNSPITNTASNVNKYAAFSPSSLPVQNSPVNFAAHNSPVKYVAQTNPVADSKEASSHMTSLSSHITLPSGHMTQAYSHVAQSHNLPMQSPNVGLMTQEGVGHGTEPGVDHMNQLVVGHAASGHQSVDPVLLGNYTNDYTMQLMQTLYGLPPRWTPEGQSNETRNNTGGFEVKSESHTKNQQSPHSTFSSDIMGFKSLN